VADVEDLGKQDNSPVLEGKRMIIFISPRKTMVKKDAETSE
jgi:hypothetical protein